MNASRGWFSLVVASVLVGVGVTVAPAVVGAGALPVPAGGDVGSVGDGWFAPAQSVSEPGEVVSFGTGGLEPVVPERLLDTRTGVGAPVGRVGPGGHVDLLVAGRGGVPASGAGAVVLNVTAVGATQASFVTVWPTGADRPTASNLNVASGDTVPNLVVVKLGAGGKVSLFNRFGEMDLLADVAGWFPEGSGLEPLVPDRVLDTRTGVGAPVGRVGAAGQVELQVTGRGGVPDTGAGAVVLNVTAVGPTAPSFVTVWPAGADRPTVSNLNLSPGRTVPNLVVVKVGDAGRVSLFNRFGDVDLVADVAGWFPDGGGFVPLVPDRILDTRSGLGAAAGRVGVAGRVELQVTGRGGVPEAGVAAVVLNVTAVDPTAASFVTAWPAGVDRPTASNLNLVAGRTVPNLVIVKVGAGGVVSLFNRFGDVDLLADVAGWFPASDDSIVMQPWVTTTLAGPGDVVEASPGRVVLSASADVPTVGGHLAVVPHSMVPDGVSGRVTSVSAGADGVMVVTLEDANLQDLFADLEVHGSFETDLSEPAPPTAQSGQRPVRRAALAPECEGGGSVSSSPSVSFGSVGGNVDFDLSDRYARVLLVTEPTVSWALSAEVSFSCKVSLGSRPVGLLGVVLFEFEDHGFTFGVSVSGQTTATMSFRAPTRIGFVYDKGDVTNLSGTDIVAEADSPASVAIEAHAGMYAEASAKAFGVLGITASLEPGFTASFDNTGCVSVDAAVDAAVAGELGRWGVGWKVELAAVTFGPLNVYRRGCGDKAWTGTIEIAVNRDDEEGVTSPRDVTSETATYTLIDASESSLSADGSGVYPARITASGDHDSYVPVWTGSSWTHCMQYQYEWFLNNVTRSAALELEFDALAGRWTYRPYLVGTHHYPNGGSFGGVSGTWVSYDCSGVNPPAITPLGQDWVNTKLGWESGTSLGLGYLNDTNPAADRLVGTTTWTLGNPPTSGTLHAATTSWSYTMTYDLTRVELE